MKKKQEAMCYTELPPWQRAKTKHQAYQMGYDKGELETRRQFNRDAEANQIKIEQQERQASIDALKNICQAGSTVVESMSKALLSFNKSI